MLRRRSPRGTHSTWRRGAGQSGEKLAVLALHVWDRRGSSSPVDAALVIGQEGVVMGRRGEQPFGQAEHDDQVQVQPDPHAHRSDQHPFAHAPDPAEIGFELEFEGAGEHVEFDRLLDRVETGQAIEGPLHPFGRLLLDRRPRRRDALVAEERAHVPARPGDALSPGLWPGRRPLGVVDQPDDELAQRPGPFGRRCGPVRPATLGHLGILFGLEGSASRSFREGGQPMVPVVSSGHHARLTGKPFPCVTGSERPSWRSRASGQPGEDVLPPESAVGKGQESEQGATHHPGGEGHHGGAVEGDAGRRQLLVGQPGIGHRAGVQDGHAVERRPRPGGVDDATHGGPDLLVAVGDGQDPGAIGAHDVHGLAVAGMGTAATHVNSANRPLDLGVGPGVPGGSGQHDYFARRCHRAEERTAMAGQPLGQVHDDGAQTAGGGPVLAAVPRRPSRAGPPRRRTPPPELARAARCSRTTSAARSLLLANASRAPSERSRSSRYAATRAVSVAAWPATGANIPGSSARAARSAAAITGVETGRRPLPANWADPRSSASRYTVTKDTAATPMPRPDTGPSAPEASRRRVATPT